MLGRYIIADLANSSTARTLGQLRQVVGTSMHESVFSPITEHLRRAGTISMQTPGEGADFGAAVVDQTDVAREIIQESGDIDEGQRQLTELLS